MIQVSLKQISVPAGHQVLLKDISWQDFQEILKELGENRASRISYVQRTLTIMTPLPEHEASKEIIGDFIKALLEELEINFWPLGSTTFVNESMETAIEPDSCFYIQNEAAIRGKNRLDLSIDPPPDLALEIDTTSQTQPELYQKLGVPELWRFQKGILSIYLLQADGTYTQSKSSRIFLNVPVFEMIPDFLNQSKKIGRNQAMKAFRNWVKELN